MNNEKIKFININGKDGDNHIDLAKVLLSEHNPRFTMLNSFDNDLSKFLITENIENKQEKIFNKLLISEGNFDDLLRLLQNIDNNGFNNKIEPIYLIENNNNYIVAEGNRRTMCLKLINDGWELPEYEDIYVKLSSYENINSEELNDENDEYNSSKNIMKTYNKCKETIEKIKIDKREFIVHYNLINLENKDELWNIIYDKHLTGERPGMRKWSRSKYFADLLNVFREGILIGDKQIINIANNINREKDFIIADFKESQFIYSCIFFGNNYHKDEKYKGIINFQIQEILEKMIELDRISALERTHSFNKIRTILTQDVLKIDKINFEENYFEINFNKNNNRINFIDKKINEAILLKFIYEKWLEKVITTRPVKNKESLIIDLFLLLKNLDIENKLSNKQLNELDEFSLTIEKLDKIILCNKNHHNEDVIIRFELARKIKISNEKFINTIQKSIKISNIEPINVFKILRDQLDWNNKGNFLNAIASTTRSIAEQLIIWLNWLTTAENGKSPYLEKISEGRILELFNDIKRGDDDSLILIWLEKSYLNQGDIDLRQSKFLKKYFKNHYITLNEFIHASHRMYIQKDYIKNLEDLNEAQDILIEIIEFIDWEKFNELNTKIIAHIKTTV